MLGLLAILWAGILCGRGHVSKLQHTLAIKASCSFFVAVRVAVPSMITSLDGSCGEKKHEESTNARLKGERESGERHNVEELRRAWTGRRLSLYKKD